MKDQFKKSKQESRDTKAKLTNSNKKVRELKERSIIYKTQNQSFESHQEVLDNRPKKKQKSHTSASDRSN